MPLLMVAGATGPMCNPWHGVWWLEAEVQGVALGYDRVEVMHSMDDDADEASEAASAPCGGGSALEAQRAQTTCDGMWPDVGAATRRCELDTHAGLLGTRVKSARCAL